MLVWDSPWLIYRMLHVLLIRLRRIYNFWLFHANIFQLLHTFGNFLYDLFGLTYLSSAQCQFMFVACFCFAENPYQTKSKRDKNLQRIILEYMWFLGGGINANGGPQWPQPTRERQVPPGAPRYLVPSSNVGWGPSSGARKIIYRKNIG